MDRPAPRAARARDHFDRIVTADGDVARAKPLPVLYLEALRGSAVGAAEAVAFEDSPNGIRAAKAAGIFCVAVPNGVTASLPSSRPTSSSVARRAAVRRLLELAGRA